MTCDACKKDIPQGEYVFDVAAAVFTAQHDDATPDFDPLWEGYICKACWETIPQAVREALT